MRLPSESEASALALAAIAWLARDERRLGGLFRLTGLDLESLRAGVEDIVVQTCVLEFLLGDESLLLSFVADERLDPAAPRLAWVRLSGRDVT